MRGADGRLFVVRFPWTQRLNLQIKHAGGEALCWEARLAERTDGTWDVRIDFGSSGHVYLDCDEVLRFVEGAPEVSTDA